MGVISNVHHIPKVRGAFAAGVGATGLFTVAHKFERFDKNDNYVYDRI